MSYELLQQVWFGLIAVLWIGYFVLEVSAARTLDRADQHWQWQVGLRQGF